MKALIFAVSCTNSSAVNVSHALFSSTSREELDKIEIKYEVIPVQSSESTTPSDGKDSTTTDKTNETGKDSVTTEE